MTAHPAAADPSDRQPPGAGLPPLQLFFAKRLALPFIWRTTSWERAQERFDREGRAILRLVEPLGRERLERKVLVSGVFGIEDNSRYWSAAMALEHLIVAGDWIADVLAKLTRREPIPYTLEIKDVKPAGRFGGAEVLGAFRGFLERYRARALFEMGDRGSPDRFAHPWFGPLTAHQWQCFAPQHQRIHRGQLEAIVRGLP